MPPALLSASLGLALVFAPHTIWPASLIAFAATALTTFAFAPTPPARLEGVFLACWMSVALNAATVHLRAGLAPRVAIVLSVNAGFWSGEVLARTGAGLDLLKALPCALVLFAAAQMIRWRVPIVVKVVASWLMAIAVLAATLQFLPVTPGYLPDHLE